MQPYSIKFGDGDKKGWLQFSKMPPAVAFPFAMVAAVDDALSKKTINQSTADAIMGAISKYGNFLADQSYAKNVGDALSAVKGDAEAMTRFVGNYPQQLFPWRAASTWIARLGDDTERRVNPDKGFLDKQVETFMQSVPGLRGRTTARLDSAGQPLKVNNGTFNNLSPFKVTNEYPAGAAAFADLMQGRLDTKNKNLDKESGKTTQTKTTGSKTLDASSKRVEKVTKGLPADIAKSDADILKNYARLSPEGKAKYTADPANQFKLHQAQYQQNKLSGKLNGPENFTAQNKLSKESITSKYSEEVKDFYALSKEQQNVYFKTDRAKATELYDQAKKLDSELGATKYKYGLGKKPKKGKTAKGLSAKKFNLTNILSTNSPKPTALRSMLKNAKMATVKSRAPKLARYSVKASKVNKRTNA